MLQLSPSAHVSGSVIAGDVVDVLYTIEGEETLTLLHSVRVLAATERIQTIAFHSDVVVSKVILSLSPEDAERVTHALSIGSDAVCLSLVGDEEAGDLPRLALPSEEQPRLSATHIDIAEFRRRFDEASVERMYRTLEGLDEAPQPVVDPVLVRQIELPEGLAAP